MQEALGKRVEGYREGKWVEMKKVVDVVVEEVESVKQRLEEGRNIWAWVVGEERAKKQRVQEAPGEAS